MKKPAILLYKILFLLLFLPFTLSSQERLDIFIRAGQSNAQGWMGDAAYYPEEWKEFDDSILFNWALWITKVPVAIGSGCNLRQAGSLKAISDRK